MRRVHVGNECTDVATDVERRGATVHVRDRLERAVIMFVVMVMLVNMTMTVVTVMMIRYRIVAVVGHFPCGRPDLDGGTES